MIEFNSMKRLLLFLFFAVFVGLALLFAFLKFQASNRFTYSPLPNFLTLFKNRQVSTLNIWLPDFNNRIGGDIKTPEVSARASLIYDLTINKVMFAKNAKEKLPMASLTKIMTAIVALENKKKDDKYFVTSEDLVGEDSMGLKEGEKLSWKDVPKDLSRRIDEVVYG